MQCPCEREEGIGPRRVDVASALLVLLDQTGRDLRKGPELLPRQPRRLAEFPEARRRMRHAIPCIKLVVESADIHLMERRIQPNNRLKRRERFDLRKREAAIPLVLRQCPPRPVLGRPSSRTRR